MKKLPVLLKQKKWTVLLLAVLLIGPLFLSGKTYLMLILCTMVIYAMASSGLDMLFGYSGQTSMGHAAYFAIGAYTSALLTTRLQLPFFAGLLAGGLLATVLGVIVAFATTKLVKHFLALATIAFGQIVYLLTIYWDSLTNGSRGIRGIPRPALFSFSFSSNLSIYYLYLAIALFAIIVKANLVKSHVGRAMIAIRENVHASNGLGINVRAYKVTAFAISAFFTGIAGSMSAHLLGYISPDSYTRTMSNLFFTMVLFGGRGTISGPIVGAVIITALMEVLQGFGNVQQLVYGSILILTVLFLPFGLMGSMGSEGIGTTLRNKVKGLFGIRVGKE